MFEDEFSALQADMVDICNEYSQGMADKIFIYAANECMMLVKCSIFIALILIFTNAANSIMRGKS